MGAYPQSHKITVEQYLSQYANDTAEKWELIDGDVYAMAGASREHNLIALNVATLSKMHLKNRQSPCKTFISDMKVRVNDNYYYPDVLVDCGDDGGENWDRYTAASPILIIEVLSKSTSLIDRTLKLWQYQTIDSLQEYVLIEQDVMQIAIYKRSQNWLAKTYRQGDLVEFTSLDLVVPIEAIYEDVVFQDNPFKVLE